MLLHVIANPRPESRSRTRQVARGLLEAYRETHPDREVLELDLFAEDLPMTSAADVETRMHQSAGSLSPEEQETFQRFNRYLEPLLNADVLVLSAPMWNFGPPWKLKQWIDTVTQARVTFRYGPQGPEGLLKGKRAVIVTSRGGRYAQGDPRESGDFLVSYLRAWLAWVGITDVQVLAADGLDAEREHLDALLAQAQDRARAVGASL